jgi:hypothetical protein
MKRNSAEQNLPQHQEADVRLEWPVVPVCLGIVVAAVVAAVVVVAAAAAGEEWECLALGAALETVGEAAAAAAEEAPVAEDPTTGLCYHHTLGDHMEPQASEINTMQMNTCHSSAIFLVITWCGGG